MAKSSGLAGKLKDLAREMRDEEDAKTPARKIGDAIRKSEGNKKNSGGGGKLSGHKN